MNTPTQKLSGKVAVVTGASKGIGAAIAKHLAVEGAAVAVNYLSSRADGEKVAAQIIATGGRAIAIGANASKHADINHLFGETKKNFGRLDILVNNAGIYNGQLLGEITEENFHRHFNLNVLGLILATQESLAYFGTEGGAIINISSVVSTLSPVGTAVYNATKSAVDGLTRTFARELGGRGIRVNSVNPGPVDTEGTRSAGLVAKFPAFVPSIPLGRIGRPEDIAPAVAFLASPDAGWITGESLFVAGGLH